MLFSIFSLFFELLVLFVTVENKINCRKNKLEKIRLNAFIFSSCNDDMRLIYLIIINTM